MLWVLFDLVIKSKVFLIRKVLPPPFGRDVYVELHVYWLLQKHPAVICVSPHVLEVFGMPIEGFQFNKPNPVLRNKLAVCTVKCHKILQAQICVLEKTPKISSSFVSLNTVFAHLRVSLQNRRTEQLEEVQLRSVCCNYRCKTIGQLVRSQMARTAFMHVVM